MIFAEISVPTPDLDVIADRFDSLERRLHSADASLDECLTVVHEWDRIRREVSTHLVLVNLRFRQDTSDADRRRAREDWDAQEPRWTELVVSMKRTLLEHRLRDELECALGTQAFARWESDVLAFHPAIKTDLVRESALGAEYVRLEASSVLWVGREKLTLASVVKHRQSGDRETRHEAERVYWDWFGRSSVQLDRTFDDLVQVRTDMARRLGCRDFVELGYRRMCRVDYGQADVERLRTGIRRHVVPLALELTRRQANSLGVDRLMAWDEHVRDPQGSPIPRGDHDWILARAADMFDAMGELGPFFRAMRDGAFLDLKSRPGKAGGGYCTNLASHGMPFIYANFNGSKVDVEALIHEMGHAFQNYQSRELSLFDYLWPTYDAAEIHSMSLEFLAWPYLESFFGADAERFRRGHLADTVLSLPYGAAIDEFQHEVYSRPELSAPERRELWRELEKSYMPWRDWGDLEYPASGGRWQAQRHIYLKPFYYIDYVLARICALQFWSRAEQDRDGAMQDHALLCRRGGSEPFQSLARSAGLKSPFDDDCLVAVVDRVRANLLDTGTTP